MIRPSFSLIRMIVRALCYSQRPQEVPKAAWEHQKRMPFAPATDTECLEETIPSEFAFPSIVHRESGLES